MLKLVVLGALASAALADPTCETVFDFKGGSYTSFPNDFGLTPRYRVDSDGGSSHSFMWDGMNLAGKFKFSLDCERPHPAPEFVRFRFKEESSLRFSPFGGTCEQPEVFSGTYEPIASTELTVAGALSHVVDFPVGPDMALWLRGFRIEVSSSRLVGIDFCYYDVPQVYKEDYETTLTATMTGTTPAVHWITPTAHDLRSHTTTMNAATAWYTTTYILLNRTPLIEGYDYTHTSMPEVVHVMTTSTTETTTSPTTVVVSEGTLTTTVTSTSTAVSTSTSTLAQFARINVTEVRADGSERTLVTNFVNGVPTGTTTYSGN